MRLFLLLMLMTYVSLVFCKHVKSLTESMGQEVIEIGAPLKDLPLGLEEEPSPESDDDKKVTTDMAPTYLRKDSKKEKTTTSVTEPRKKQKDIDKVEEITQDDEEARIEKELAELYKDTADYKSESTEEKEDKARKEQKETTTDTTTTTTTELTTEEYPFTDELDESEMDKPIGRERNSFKFQPDSTDKAGIERFRTSVDEINCNNRQSLTVTEAADSSMPSYTLNQSLTMIAITLCCIFIST